MQLARIATGQRQGSLALEYLSRLTDPQPMVRLLRAEALHWAGKQAAALSMLDALSKEIGADDRFDLVSFRASTESLRAASD